MIDSNLKTNLEHIKELLDSESISESEYNLLKEEILFKKNNFEDLISKKDSNQSDGEKFRNQDKSIIYNDQKSKKNYSVVYIVIFSLFIGFWIWNSKDKHNNYDSNLINDTINSSNDINDSSSINSTTTCKICGRSFSGDGYDKIDGIWQKNKNIQTELCSPSCAMKEEKNINEKYDKILEKYGNQSKDNSSIQDASIQHYGEYHEGSDGRVYENNSCSLCKGTGIESRRNIATGELEQRICPMCDGRGIRSY